jgi:hypothetical protein
MSSAPLPAHSLTRRLRVAGFLLFLIGLSPLGCGERLPPLATVKGRVTVDKVILSSGQVSLVPVDPASKVPPSSGQIATDGTYEVFTGGKSGAPLGKYKIRVSPSMQNPSKEGPPFNAKYLDPNTSKLAFEVVENPAADQYDLKLTK